MAVVASGLLASRSVRDGEGVMGTVKNRPKVQCKSEGCQNLCYPPNIYCGRCAGYAHEMTKAERRECLINAASR